MKKIIICTLILTMISSATANSRIYLNRVSAYTLHRSQTDSSPNTGACGRMKPNVIAVSRDLFYRLGKVRCGQHVTLIDAFGKSYRKIIWDTMNPRYSRSVDILFAHKSQAIQFGVKRNWRITLR